MGQIWSIQYDLILCPIVSQNHKSILFPLENMFKISSFCTEYGFQVWNYMPIVSKFMLSHGFALLFLQLYPNQKKDISILDFFLHFHMKTKFKVENTLAYHSVLTK